MGPEEIETMLEHHPFVPFRMTLNSGDQVIIHDPAVVTVIGLSIGIFDQDERGTARLRFVSLPNISIVQPLAAGDNSNEGRER